MERIKNLNSYQKGVLIFMTVMTLIFAIIYPKTISKVGYRYNDAILVPIQETGQTIYKGKIQGEQAQFIVAEDKSVVFQYGNKTYGTYIMKEDPTAIPEDYDLSEQMIDSKKFIRKDKLMLLKFGLIKRLE